MSATNRTPFPLQVELLENRSLLSSANVAALEQAITLRAPDLPALVDAVRAHLDSTAAQATRELVSDEPTDGEYLLKDSGLVRNAKAAASIASDLIDSGHPAAGQAFEQLSATINGLRARFVEEAYEVFARTFFLACPVPLTVTIPSVTSFMRTSHCDYGSAAAPPEGNNPGTPGPNLPGSTPAGAAESRSAADARGAPAVAGDFDRESLTAGDSIAASESQPPAHNPQQVGPETSAPTTAPEAIPSSLADAFLAPFVGDPIQEIVSLDLSELKDDAQALFAHLVQLDPDWVPETGWGEYLWLAAGAVLAGAGVQYARSLRRRTAAGPEVIWVEEAR